MHLEETTIPTAHCTAHTVFSLAAVTILLCPKSFWKGTENSSSFAAGCCDGCIEEGGTGLLITQQVFHLALLLFGNAKAGIREGVTYDLQRRETERLLWKGCHCVCWGC